MKKVKSSDFRDEITELTEPVEVTRYNTTLGTWFPASVTMTNSLTHDDVTAVSFPVVHPETRTITNSTDWDRPFTPAPKPGKKRKP